MAAALDGKAPDVTKASHFLKSIFTGVALDSYFNVSQDMLALLVNFSN